MWFDERVAGGYELWYETAGRRADFLEKVLLGGFLRMFPGVRTVLEVGCGTGHFTRWFNGQGLWTLGLDVSPAMLNEARRRGDGRYLRADALAMPFADGTFDLVVLVTALEFIPDAHLALAEAVRVARRGILLGVLNRWSPLALRRRLKGGAIWRQAHFFSTRELTRLARHAAGERFRGLGLRTALFPPGLELAARFLPLGGFIGARLVLETSCIQEHTES